MLYIGLPSHNEATTVGVLLWRLRTVLAEVSREYEVVVYDDASTDGTADVLAPYARVLPLTLLRGERRVGTGGAMDAIVRHVARTTRYPRRDALLLMQADFTDSPALVPEFLRRFEGGADLVIGERRSPGDAPASVRRLLTASRWVLRPFVGITDVRDLTTSYRLARVAVLRDLLKSINDAPVCTGEGWSAQAELLLKAAPHARRIETIPVTPSFGVRTRETRRQAWPDTVALARWAWRHRGLRIEAKVIAREGDGASEPSEVAQAIEEDRLARAERASERTEARREPGDANRRERGRGERSERDDARGRETTRSGARDRERTKERGPERGRARAERRDREGTETTAPDEGGRPDASPPREGRRERGARRERAERRVEEATTPGSALPVLPAGAASSTAPTAPERGPRPAEARSEVSAPGEDGGDEERLSRRRRRGRRGRGAAVEGADVETAAADGSDGGTDGTTDERGSARAATASDASSRIDDGTRPDEGPERDDAGLETEGEAATRRRRRSRRGRRRSGDGEATGATAADERGEAVDGEAPRDAEPRRAERRDTERRDTDGAEDAGRAEDAGGEFAGGEFGDGSGDAGERTAARRRRNRRGRRGGRRRSGGDGDGGSADGGSADGGPSAESAPESFRADRPVRESPGEDGPWI